MSMRTGILMFMAAACIWPARAQDQTKAVNEKPSAKEMFLNPRQMPYGVQDEASPPTKPRSTPSVKPTVKPKPKPKPAEAAAPDQAQPGQPAEVQIIPASYSGVPLGLRYTVRKKDGDQTTDVLSDTEFHSGDRIQLSVEVNDTGYLYIINQGTSGTWKAMFPSPEIADGDNRVQRGPVYTVPPRHVFTFSGEPGVEKLFVIFSRQPVQEIDSLIYSLKGGQKTPVAEPGRKRPVAGVLTASAEPIDNSQIVQMRAAYTRDLIIEDLGHEQSGQQQGGQQQGGQQQDKSVYVVNPKGSADSRVVADIPLTHK